MKSRILKLSLSALGLAASCFAQAPAAGAPLRPGTLLQTDFEAKSWPGLSTEAVGTIDVAGSTQPSLGLRAAKMISSGPLPIRNLETNLAKLTLAFGLAASANRPVQVLVESFNARRQRTGALQTMVYPAAPDFYQRYALDLSSFKPSGAGKFQPGAPFVGLRFELGEAWKGVAKPEMRLDNVHLAAPAFYVSPSGDDKNSGRSEGSAFATPQKALDEAQAGDIILLMGGVYNGGLGSVASFRRAGTPSGWITLKNYPGQTPTLTSNGWNIVSIARGSKQKPYDGPTLAYLEVRGLHILGEADKVKEKFPESIGKPDGRSNSNGIAVDGRFMTHVPHHIRLAGNLVEYCPAQGLGAIEADWVTIEGNISRCNSWTTIYGTSGISTLGASNFDGSDNVYKMLIRNNISCRNETFQKWGAIGKISDGNGIIIDVNQKTDTRPDGSYIGRTLVQSNLCFDNGGSGIHTVKANRVDIINNTAYLNSASKSLEYSQIYSYSSDDVRILNNILAAPVADVAAGEKPEPVNKLSGQNGKVIFAHNLYFGGNIAPDMGEGDAIGDPQFLNPSRDFKVADFHLKANSPAIGAGVAQPFAPFLDLDGKPRAQAPDKGAYQR